MVDLEPFKEWVVEEDAPELSDWKTQLIHGNLPIHIIIGNYFIKHHKWGKPKLRLVWTDDKLTVINWGDPKDAGEGQKVKGMLRVSEIKEVKEGLVKAKINDKKAPQRSSCTFSIISGGRTLELECPTIVHINIELIKY